MVKRILLIGGGTCSGKTSFARKMAREEDGAVFSVDDRLGEYAGQGIAAGCPICIRHAEMPLDVFFMRDPQVQCDELIAFYKEIAPFVKEDLLRFCRRTDAEFVAAEGIAFLPEITRQMMAEDSRMRCRYLFTEKALHDRLYREREWVEDFLAECREPEEAFRRWMERDALFAGYVRKTAELLPEPYRTEK